MQQYFAIDNWGLLIAVLMVCIAAGVSALMKLGVAKSLLWATARSLVQLLAMGFILEYVIRAQNVWLVIGLIVVMLVAAAQITMSRATNHIGKQNGRPGERNRLARPVEQTGSNGTAQRNELNMAVFQRFMQLLRVGVPLPCTM